MKIKKTASIQKIAFFEIKKAFHEAYGHFNGALNF